VVVQLVLGREMVQRVVDPSMTVMVPVGAVPGNSGITVEVKVIDCSLPYTA